MANFYVVDLGQIQIFPARNINNEGKHRSALRSRNLFSFLWPRQESNLNLELRKLLYYPLYYEACNVILLINQL